MPFINSDKQVVFNNFVEQMKKKKSKLTADEWNHLWNIISAQADMNAEVLESLKGFVIGNSEGILTFPDNFNSLLEFLQAEINSKSKFSISEGEPLESKEGDIWIEIC